MAGIGELSVSVTARTEKAMKNIRSFRKSINRLPGAISSAARSMGGMATAAAGLVGVGAIGNEIRKSFENIDNLAKTADKIGIATDKLGALRFAAEESGVAAATTDMALQRMVRRISEAAQGSGEAKGALQELGLSAAMLAKMTPDQQFAAIAEAMGSVSNQSDKVRLAMRLFDSEGVSLVNTLKLGKDGLAAYEAEAAKLGITVSRFEAAQIEAANDAFGRIGKSVEGITNRIAIGLAPIVESVSNSLSEWGKSGQVSSDQISMGIRKVGTAIGFVQDGLDFWLRFFKSTRAYLTEFFAWTAEKFVWLSKVISDTLNKIPGVETEPLEFTAVFADELKLQAEQARKEADAAWRKPLPSEGVNAFFDNLDQKIKDSKSKFDEMAEQKTASQNFSMQFGDQIQGVGSMIGNLVGKATGSAHAAAGDLVNALQAKPLRVEMAQTAQRGSREEFQLLRQMQNQEANRTAKQQQQQTSLLGGVKTGVDRLASLFESNKGQMDRLITAFENLDLGESV